MGVAYVKGLQGEGETMRSAACASPTLQKLLREDWKFEGHFVSDCGAVKDFFTGHMLCKNIVDSAAHAINNGCDLNCGDTYLFILEAYEKGLVSEETITEAAVRLFTTRYMLGLLDGSEYDRIPYTVVECPEHLALAKKAALESAVLLKNNGLLPLDKSRLRTVGVIGPNADSRASLIGNYHGSASRYVTVQEGILDYLGDDVRVLTSAGCQLFRDRAEPIARAGDRLAEAVTVAENSDVVILCLGLDETLEGEEGDACNNYASGDKETLQLPAVQMELMDAIARTGKPTVLCLLAGSDIDMSFAREHFDAILVLWYPGAQGGTAAAELLFGDESPSGKLPVTFYESLDELPGFDDYSMAGRTYRYMEGRAQYPFGFGLTYGDVRVTEAKIMEEDGANLVQVQVENRGGVDTGDVVQVYVKCQDSPYAPRNPALCAFKRVFLRAGEVGTLRIPLSADAFTVVDEDGCRIVDGKDFIFYIGTSQPDERSAELSGAAAVEVVWHL